MYPSKQTSGKEFSIPKKEINIFKDIYPIDSICRAKNQGYQYNAMGYFDKDEALGGFFKKKSYKEYRIRYRDQIIFWVLYFSFNVLRWAIYYDNFDYSLKTNLIGFPLHIGLVYLNIYYFMPRYVYFRKYITYILAVLSVVFLATELKFYLTKFLIDTSNSPENLIQGATASINYIIVNMLGEIYVISFVTAIKITIDRLRESSKIHELQKRQLKTELRFLRSQISPHFFFNTLNNIYALTLEKSDKAPNVILKLSELMRYLLYTTNKKKQNLKNEIDCIQNYIELERIRFDDKLNVNMTVMGGLEGCNIPPMLLVPLIENCFKHGANNSLGKIMINIEVKVVDQVLYFSVENSVPEFKEHSKKQIKEAGIGLSNVKKRLALGYDQNDYELLILEKNSIFKVNLKLNLSNKIKNVT